MNEKKKKRESIKNKSRKYFNRNRKIIKYAKPNNDLKDYIK